MVVGLVVGLPGRIVAQEPVPEGPRAEQLRQMIEERFAERLTTELALSGDQEGKVRAVLATWATKRRSMEKDERATRQQLTGAMRPGVAADEKTVIRLTDRILSARIEYVQTFKDEIADLAAVLTPIQRAQYVLLRDRLLQRVEEIRNQRAQEFPQRKRLGRLRP